MKDNRTAIDKFIEKYWMLNVTRREAAEERELTTKELDMVVHDFIH